MLSAAFRGTRQANMLLTLQPPLHFKTLKDYSVPQIISLLRRSLEIKALLSQLPIDLRGRTMAMLFSKRSTRTRVSCESGWVFYGGSALFLGKDDVHWAGGGEPLSDTAKVMSSMVDCIVARVDGHEVIETLAEHSTVPVINALSDKYHPLQLLADAVTLYETFVPNALSIPYSPASPLPHLPPVHVAWVGDANNVLNSILMTLARIGARVTVATPKGYDVDPDVLAYAKQNSPSGSVEHFNSPKDAIHGADVIVTDTWISMGMEAEKQKRLAEFKGFRVTEQMAKKGGTKPHWKFMHCLPRKQEEVDDEVFYNPAQNLKCTTMAVYELLMSKHLKR
ncbi:mitochondrial ornithine carbamoyltransferase [Cladochytrium replicatum]|nr:mitochondrial ornithine carbamoyltransferase [Cladochytrium replicatum]